jgi:hypothetical protein
VAKLLQGSNLCFALDQQTLHDKWRLNPRPIKVADKHANLQVKRSNGYFMWHSEVFLAGLV